MFDELGFGMGAALVTLHLLGRPALWAERQSVLRF